MNERIESIEVPQFVTKEFQQKIAARQKELKERREAKRKRKKRIRMLFLYSILITILFFVAIFRAIALDRQLEKTKFQLETSESYYSLYKNELNEFKKYVHQNYVVDESTSDLVSTSVKELTYIYPYEKVLAEYTGEEIELLAKTVYAEAGNQDLKGKQLVVDTVLNRVDDEDGYFPNSIEEVIKQKNQFETWPLSIEMAEPSYSDYLAVFQELSVPKEQRIDDRVMYFTAGQFNPYGTPSYKYGDHYFSYK